MPSCMHRPRRCASGIARRSIRRPRTWSSSIRPIARWIVGDAHVSASDQTEFIVDLPLLPAGTYVVAWRVQSADDGHVTGGSYIFRIARPDGTVPPIPAKLPTGHFPGAGGAGSTTGTSLDGPTLVQAVATWVALLMLALWAGGVVWETWILPPVGQRDPDLAAAAAGAARRFGRLAPYALGVLLVADLGIILGQSAELAGGWPGAFSPLLLRAILFGSRFGTFWWLRQGAALAALGLTLASSRLGLSVTRAAPIVDTHTHPNEPVGALALADPNAIPDWRRSLLAALRGVPRLPDRLARGLRMRASLGLAQCALAALLIVAFALSGHAAAVPAREFGYAITVDLVHLTANAAWVGGLLYIGIVLMPALATLAPRARARVLALGLPEFSALAIVCALLLAATGSLNTTIHLTSLAQFVTTAYGRVLFVKIELFLLDGRHQRVSCLLAAPAARTGSHGRDLRRQRQREPARRQ